MSAPRQNRRSDPVLESPGELATGHVDGLELELLNDVENPDSDGVPMSETDFQFRALHNARHYLLTHFHGRPASSPVASLRSPPLPPGSAPRRIRPGCARSVPAGWHPSRQCASC